MQTSLPSIASLLLATFVVGCSDSAPADPSPPKPKVEIKPTHVSGVPRPAPEPEPELPTPLFHTIAEGQTLWDIARVYGVSLEQLMATNGYDADDVKRLRPGTRLKVERDPNAVHAARPEPRPELHDGAYHVLSEGESLWTLARLYDVPIETLMTRNGFSEDVYGRLRPGQAVIIPGVPASAIKHAEPAKSVRPTGLEHRVAADETVWDIARRYEVSVGEIMSANSLSPEQVQNLSEGQKLLLPGLSRDSRGIVRREVTAGERNAKAVARRLGLGSLKVAGQLLHGRVEPRWIAAAGGSRGLAGTLRWPVANGWFVRGFGSGEGGYHKAMDIMGRIGWNVRAAADGIVGYAGNQVPGFGNMVMVVHAGGWVTLYAHNSVNFVTAGQRVRRGAVLAEVGSTGRSQGPHVHFELIYAGQNCDPAPLFRPGVRHRSGKYSPLRYTSWRDPDERPRQVKCAKRQKHPVGRDVMSEDPGADAQPVDERTSIDLPSTEL